MHEETLRSLKAALELTPENKPLRLALVRAAVESGAIEVALESLVALAPDDVNDSADRLFLADLLVMVGQGERGLAWLADLDSPEADLARANLLLDLDREEQAEASYRRAVTANPALQDRGVEDRLARRVLRFPASGRAAEATPQAREAAEPLQGSKASLGDIATLVGPQLERITFADVGGLDDVKKLIHRKIIAPFEKPSLFAKFRKKAGGGILLYGPPGVGKTLLARATAGECHAQFFNVGISDVLDMWLGESERKLHALFEMARQSKPSVLFFDEIEALGAVRRTKGDTSSSHLVSQFLSEMDGFAQDNEGVLIMGASNVPWAIDSAFRRPGRFDRVIFVAPPDRAARVAILETLLHDRPQAETIDIARLAERSSGFSGADLNSLVETAIDLAIERSVDAGKVAGLTNAMLAEALKEVRPTTLEWLTTARNYARYSNESGQYNDVLDFLRKHGK